MLITSSVWVTQDPSGKVSLSLCWRDCVWGRVLREIQDGKSLETDSRWSWAGMCWELKVVRVVGWKKCEGY